MLRRITRLQLLIAGGLLLFILTLPVALAFPVPGAGWLSKNASGGSDAETREYYTTIVAPPTLSAWKTKYGFDGSDEVHAVYYNGGDLGFGRDMHCRKKGNDVACYVANHGLGPGSPPDAAVNDAINGQNALPVVAMVYDSTKNNGPNDVQFFVYDQNGTRLNKVALDSEGEKFSPQVCLPCHGGRYDATTDSVTGAQFLPFDAESFKYSQMSGYPRSDQQEAFRKLNALVLATNPTPAIQQLINGWYGNAVSQPGQTPNDNFVPPGFAGKTDLYNEVIKPYCRTCHIASTNYPFNDYSQFSALSGSIKSDVFSTFIMPHAELTSHNFWSSTDPLVAPAYLADELNFSVEIMDFSLTVTRLDDPPENGCAFGDCSLREAIIAANALPGLNVIHFSTYGTIGLNQGSGDDTAAQGDLDITGELIILGPGGGRTKVDGKGLDTVFTIQNGANVIMRGITIQNGATTGSGGGFYVLNLGQLTLVNSVVRNNRAGSGGGIANFGRVSILNSIIRDNVATIGTGGGIYNTYRLNLANSTISGNKANGYGGGIGVISSNPNDTNLTNLTITNNTADLDNNGVGDGGGIMLQGNSGALRIRNTIIAKNFDTPNNSGGGNIFPDVREISQPFLSLGYNLIGNGAGAAGFTGPGDQVGNSSNPIDPLLDNLTGNPAYHPLREGSPAIDKIPAVDCYFVSFDTNLAFKNGAPVMADQQGQFRPLDGDGSGSRACDIGAYEAPEKAPSGGGDQKTVHLPFINKGQ
jgi:hypothetical protein